MALCGIAQRGQQAHVTVKAWKALVEYDVSAYKRLRNLLRGAGARAGPGLSISGNHLRGDELLRRKVEALLASRQRVGSFIEPQLLASRREF